MECQILERSILERMKMWLGSLAEEQGEFYLWTFLYFILVSVTTGITNLSATEVR